MSQNNPKPEFESTSDQELDQALQAALEQESTMQSASADELSSDGQGTLESQLAESTREVLRVRAEMENYRKRMQRDSDQQLKYANVPLVRDLIEVVDNLYRALEAASQESTDGLHSTGATQTTALRDGVQMVLDQLAGVLGKYGCKRIESVGHEFDPNFHEAITQMSSPEYAAGVVMQEVAAGYLLHDRVVRPSSVIVSTGAPA
jgi:molecular chaperone GrpE